MKLFCLSALLSLSALVPAAQAEFPIEVIPEKMSASLVVDASEYSDFHENAFAIYLKDAKGKVLHYPLNQIIKPNEGLEVARLECGPTAANAFRSAKPTLYFGTISTMGFPTTESITAIVTNPGECFRLSRCVAYWKGTRTMASFYDGRLQISFDKTKRTVTLTLPKQCTNP